MQKMIQPEADAFLAKKRRRRLWTRLVSVLGCVVVFCTTYALILPAITAEKTVCGFEEHTHSDECYSPLPAQVQTVLSCTYETLGVHSHTEDCYDADGQLICGLADYVAHTHDENCYDAEGVLVCTLPERTAHVHTDSCYAAGEEGHVHTDSCYELQRGELICTLEENEEHTHDDACYEQLKILVCPLEEQALISQPVFICEEVEAPVHQHSESCFETVEPVRELICQLPEHVHTDSCYEELTPGDPTADLETAADWEAGMSGVVLTGDYRADLLAIAETQLGYHESTLNFIIDEAGLVKGYSRYGEWFGLPYGDWCAMFVSFCLRYAEVPNFPYNCGCTTWINALSSEEYGLYEKAGEYEPLPGDIIFFDFDGDRASDHVGIVAGLIGATETETAKLRTIEGNCADAVCYGEYEADSPVILGFGRLPEKETGYSCEKGSHLHNQYCYSYGGLLLCPVEEHAHSEDCLLSSDTPLTLQQRIDDLIREIDALPTNDEIEEILNAYDESGDEEGFNACFEALYHQAVPLYINYQALEPELQELVTNRDKLLDLEWLWSAMPYAVTNTVDVTAVNKFSWSSYGGALIVHNDNGISVGNSGMGETNFSYWYAVLVEYENGHYVVKQIWTDNGSSKSSVYASGTGFVLLFHTGKLNTSVNVNVGDIAVLSSDFWKTSHSYTGTVYGTVTFSSAAAEKNEKDNSDQLHVVGAASTRNFIELNLYDYGSGSTGRNINDKYNADTKMPGFQQSGGTSNIASLDDFKSTGYMNFGDIITDDRADGRLVTLASQNPQGINQVKDTANSPISRYEEVMSKTLINGYPALADGTSLGYLFGAESYSRKMNNLSVDGLFQYDPVTGAYSFNSRTNFAQFNSGSDTFTLYQEIFTPNFIMYPFGNFMPFNDIVYDSKQVSQINEDYFEELRLQANYLYQQGKGDQYAQLAKVLGQFLDYAQQDNWGADWTAERALEHYFYWGSELPKDDENNFNQISLDNLYSLDYDVESDFYFGMEMKMNFFQPKGGLTGNDGQQPMVFYFTGDDDVWVYIDGVLFLDLSGIHRHVGGEIDFVNGEVKYYSLNTMTGDVSTSPYKTVKFSELVDTSLLNEKGTFKDYSSHSFNFYYMERGSGSSVCRMNFNFPLLRKNTISVTKELTVDEQDKLDLLGNPDFSFQVLKADNNGNKTTELFIGAGSNYKIYNSDNEQIGIGTTDANGVFTLKAGQRAEFEGIAENSGQYYVRELLDAGLFEQYGAVYVDGTSQTTNYDVTVGSDTFKGLDSTVKDMSDGSTVFHFSNQVTFNKLGSLEISKVLNTYPQTRSLPNFDFEVTLDGVLLPVGATYTVDGETKTVSSAGIITVPAGATAKISNILAGSKFTVKETALSSAGYTVTYSGTGVASDGTSASGTILVNSSIQVTVTNSEKGTTVNIPVVKTVFNPDGTERAFHFKLVQVTGQNGETPVENGTELELPISVTDSGAGVFTLTYLEKDFSALPVNTFYYKITELDDGGLVDYDESVYVAEVTVSSADGEFTAALTKLWKDAIEVTDTLQASFTNTLLSDLTIQKVVSGVETKAKFLFKIELTRDSLSLNGTYRTTLSDGTGGELSITNGKAQFELGKDETITIHGLPYGTSWTITETGADGYIVSWQVGENSTDGASVSGILDGSHSAICTNTAGFELPETGGAGTQAYIMGGLLFMSLSASLLFYIHLKRRKEETGKSS